LPKSNHTEYLVSLLIAKVFLVSKIMEKLVYFSLESIKHNLLLTK
jgi:hypothetical protein